MIAGEVGGSCYFGTPTGMAATTAVDDSSSAEQQQLLVSHSKGGIRTIECATGTILAGAKGVDMRKPSALSLSPDGTTVYIANAGGIYCLNPMTGSSGSSAVCLAPPGSFSNPKALVTCGSQKTLLLILDDVGLKYLWEGVISDVPLESWTPLINVVATAVEGKGEERVMPKTPVSIAAIPGMFIMVDNTSSIIWCMAPPRMKEKDDTKEKDTEVSHPPPSV
jgi:hypothetical protein